MNWLNSVVLLIISSDLILQCSCSEIVSHQLNTQTTNSNVQSISKNITNERELVTVYSNLISIDDNLTDSDFLLPTYSNTNHEQRESPILTKSSKPSHVEAGNSTVQSTQIFLRQNTSMSFYNIIETLIEYFRSLFTLNG